MFVVVISEPRTYEDALVDPVVGPWGTEQEAREWGFAHADGFHVKAMVTPGATLPAGQHKASAMCPNCAHLVSHVCDREFAELPIPVENQL